MASTINSDNGVVSGSVGLKYASDNSGVLALQSNSNTALSIDSTGLVTLPYGQIKFPATQNASSDANTLDDYEEGTFTVSFIGDSGTSLVTLTSNNCKYTKIGNRVFYSISVDSSSALSGATNTVRISGLPFTISSTQYDSASIWLYGGFSFTLNNGIVQTRTQVNTNTMYLQLTNQGSGANITNSYFSGGLNFIMTGHYTV